MADPRSIIVPEVPFRFPIDPAELARVDEDTRQDLERLNQREIENRFNLQRRLIFHDDFLYIGAVPDVGDTHWEDYGTPGAFTVGGVAGRPGIIDIGTPAVGGQWYAIGKSDLGTQLGTDRTQAFYMKVAWSVSDFSQESLVIGLLDAAGGSYLGTGNGVFFLTSNNTASTTPTLSFSTRAAGTTTTTALTAVSGWHTVELMANTSWAAGSLDGGAWTVHTTNIPTAGMMPYLAIYPYTAASRLLRVDYVHMDLVTDLLGPP